MNFYIITKIILIHVSYQVEILIEGLERITIVNSVKQSRRDNVRYPKHRGFRAAGWIYAREMVFDIPNTADFGPQAGFPSEIVFDTPNIIDLEPPPAFLRGGLSSNADMNSNSDTYSNWNDFETI